MGDGIISYALNLALQKISPSNLKLINIDLSGREKKNSSEKIGFRELFIKYSIYLPEYFRLLIVRLKLRSVLRGVSSHWEENIKSADLILLGGGNLFSDIDLNFPFKIEMVLRIAKKYNKKVNIISVGVSDNWSKEALDILRPLLKSVGGIVSCRDSKSASLLSSYFEIPKPSLMVDPAFFLKFLRDDATHNISLSDEPRCFGICISCPSNLWYSGNKSISKNDNYHVSFYYRIINLITANGYKVKVFTNGAAEDEGYMWNNVVPTLSNNLLVDYSESPKTHIDLVELIKSFDCLVAYRMHTAIVGLNFGIPSFVINWDCKIEAIFDDLKLNNFVLQQEELLDEKKIFIRILKEIENVPVKSFEDEFFSFMKGLKRYIK